MADRLKNSMDSHKLKSWNRIDKNTMRENKKNGSRKISGTAMQKKLGRFSVKLKNSPLEDKGNK